MYWSSSSGRIELQITKRQAASCSHPGPCDADVRALSNTDRVRRQLNKISPDLLITELLEYGAWEAQELMDHAQNRQRLLWIACNDIYERMSALSALKAAA